MQHTLIYLVDNYAVTAMRIGEAGIFIAVGMLIQIGLDMWDGSREEIRENNDGTFTDMRHVRANQDAATVRVFMKAHTK